MVADAVAGGRVAVIVVRVAVGGRAPPDAKSALGTVVLAETGGYRNAVAGSGRA